MVGSTGTLMTMRLVRSKLRKREESSATAAQTANNATTITANNVEAQTVSFGLQSRTNSYNNNIINNNNNNNNNNNVQYNNYNNCNGGNYERQQQVCNSNNNSNATTPTTPTITLNAVDNTQTTILTATTTTQGQDQVDQVVTFTRTNGIGSNGSVNNNNTSWVFPPKAPTPNIYNCMNNDALLTVNEKNGFKGLGFRRQLSGRFKRLVTKKPEPTPVIPPELKPQLKTIYVY